ncbi:hypothetical protein Hdeb2414_s0012g00393931 [Helianthus debilis subsp. tardiflorus]
MQLPNQPIHKINRSIFPRLLNETPPLCADQAQMQLASTPYVFGADNSSRFITEDSSAHFFSPALRNSFIFKDFSYGEGCSSGSGMVSGQLGPAFD